MPYDVIVLGAGAAGLMCAATAGQRGRRVLVLEHQQQIGKKILISGGGRANFTNLHTGPENYLSANPHFAKSALARYRPADFIALVEKHRIPYHEKKLGQLFCDRSAHDLVNLLRAECEAGSVEMATGRSIVEIRRNTGYVVETSQGAYEAPALVVATGGLSIPKIGATPLGYRIAEQFGVKLQKTRPALVPLVLAESDKQSFCDLTGVAAEVTAACGGQSFREKMLITHRGLSGPAILQISSYWHGKESIAIDLLPDTDVAAVWEERRQTGDRSAFKTVLSEFLPKRLADRWVQLNGDPATAAERLHRWTVKPSGTEGYEKAEVTAGGVDTNELSSKTLESRKVPGLFFVGEVVDVTGHLGGFNFQWAWASGYAAGQAV